MIQSFVFQFLILIFACLIAHQMLGRAVAMSLLAEKRRNKIFFVSIPVIALTIFVFNRNFLICATPFLFLTPLAWMRVTELIRRAQFEKAALEILDLTVLRMKGGQSFRQALNQSITDLSPYVRFYFYELMSHLEVENTASATALRQSERDFLKIILSVNSSMTRQIEKLMSLRANEKLKNHFRLKSRQMTIQVRVQASILVCFYFALAVFQVVRDPQILGRPYFWISLSAMGAGVFLLYTLPRGFRWRV